MRAHTESRLFSLPRFICDFAITEGFMCDCVWLCAYKKKVDCMQCICKRGSTWQMYSAPGSTAEPQNSCKTPVTRSAF